MASLTPLTPAARLFVAGHRHNATRPVLLDVTQRQFAARCDADTFDLSRGADFRGQQRLFLVEENAEEGGAEDDEE